VSVLSPSIARRIGSGLLALLLLGAGTTHFLRPSAFVQIVPPAIPWPLAAVYLSGLAELALGVGLLVPRLSRAAALGAAALFVAVFPANVYHWLGNVQVDGRAVPGWYHAVRLPLQGVLVAWALWLAWRRPEGSASGRAE
jgi:uncharacterized membrane protein